MRRGLLARLARAERGTALIEFTIVVPVMLILYVASVQVADAIACSRKVTITTRAVADLMAQNTSGTTSKAEIQGMLAASTQVMAPFATSSAFIRLSEVTTDNQGVSRVVWSQAMNGAPLAANAVYPLPTAMKIPGVYLLLAEVNYSYKPSVDFGFMTSKTLSDSIYMVPRNTNNITCSDC
ncbi:TadE/TadG family type IV pilus assembly protein [Sphingomonas morindae]|uniref:Pilus assembly protein n=1 Tax=Sphingomonas morindae TaxID=1541170 RepID=A0ABY4X5Q7_9SPHN|nr:TadE/TadG family type IV pilus assembly protein [Sphingomonas morindae]USI72211.1 pilus assembly protein [Sphingomonas morindae]